MHRVAVLSVTYRRPDEFKRLLVSLRRCYRNIAVVSVCDNAGDQKTLEAVEAERVTAPYKILYKKSETNNGFASGLNQAIAHIKSVRDEPFTHYLICDDDIAFEEDILAELLAALEKSGAASAAPALTDKSGMVVAVPMLQHREDEGRVKRNIPPNEFKKLFRPGHTPPIVVCMGTCHLVKASALEKAGSYREDFWLMGEDLDFSHRIVAQKGGSIFVPWVFVAHLSGAPLDPKSAGRSHYFKSLALLQNYTYMAYHTANCEYIRGRYFDLLRGKGLMPWYRGFLAEFAWRKEAVFDLFSVVFAAWVLKQPAGGSVGNRVRRRRANFAV
jgi:GT2 family glycosyltransferase